MLREAAAPSPLSRAPRFLTRCPPPLPLSDWYSTLCALAGVDPHDGRAASAGLPGIDSLSQWDYLSGKSNDSARTTAHLSHQAYLSGRLKLLTEDVSFACWGGPTYPNASAGAGPKFGQYGSPCNATLRCGTGCLFDVVVSRTGNHCCPPLQLNVALII